MIAPLLATAVVFWSGGQTWVVEPQEARLWRANGWYATAGDKVYRYAVRSHAARPSDPATGGVASRWTTVERAEVGRFGWEPLTPAPELPARGATQDERAVLQFLGDRLTLLRFRRGFGTGADASTVSAATLRLPAGEPVAQPGPASFAVDWVSARLPGSVPGCAREPSGILERELPGGGRSRWLLLEPSSAGCGDAARLVALDRPAPSPLPRGVADRRVSPDGRFSLTLEGAPLAPASWRSERLLDLDEPCVARRLLLEREGGPPVELGAVQRLDGTRFLAPGDPLLGLLETHFLPAGEACYAALRAGPPGEPRAHRCRIQQLGRAWGGPADLSAAAGFEVDGERLVLRVRVVDPTPMAEDSVRFYVGSKRPAVHDRAPGEEGWRPLEGGYEVELGVGLRELGSPPSVTIRVHDADPDGAVELWVAGARVTRHQPTATPIVEPTPR